MAGSLQGVAPAASSASEETAHPERPVYAAQAELIFSLVGYAVGVGNVWRFPYLTYTYGGGAFLIPYGLSLLFMGVPLFVLELGLGQLTRRGTLGMWTKIGLPRWQGVGLAAILTTFMVALYYITILAWTIYYLGRTIAAIPSGQLPWSDELQDCPAMNLYVHQTVANSPYLIDSAGFLNSSFVGNTWCPDAHGAATAPADYIVRTVQPNRCPAQMAKIFWEAQALKQSSGLDDFGGLNLEMLLCLTIAWVLIWLVVFNCVKSSGKVVYFTATFPYLCLAIFLVRALTLPNALTGLKFLFEPDYSHLSDPQVWMDPRCHPNLLLLGHWLWKHHFLRFLRKEIRQLRAGRIWSGYHQLLHTLIAGCVTFPVLGFLAAELHKTDPCIAGDSLDSLKSIGLSGTGLAFVAFPIAISQMPGSFFFAILFFFMMLLLGIDSQFAYIEAVATVLMDAGIGDKLPRPLLSGIICFISYIIGFLFVTNAGVYFLELFDNYVSIYVMFAVGALECLGLMWTCNGETWRRFKILCEENTGIRLGWISKATWGYICPALCVFLVVVSVTPPFAKVDVMNARSSKAFPEGTGYFPEWSIAVGWILATVPFALMLVVAVWPNVLKSSLAGGSTIFDEMPK